MKLRVEPARSVRIAVPAYTDITQETQRSLFQGVKALTEAGIEVEDLDMYSCCYIDYGRNILAARFLRGKATDMVFIDGDMGFEPQELVRLCQSDRPLVAGIYRKKMDKVEYVVAPIGTDPDADGYVDCHWLPTGFMRINRSVFEGLTVPRYADSAGEAVDGYFLCQVRDGAYRGEDVEFCRLVREAGGQCSAFLDMRLRHVAIEDGKEHAYAGNWGHHLRERMQAAA